MGFGKGTADIEFESAEIAQKAIDEYNSKKYNLL